MNRTWMATCVVGMVAGCGRSADVGAEPEPELTDALIAELLAPPIPPTQSSACYDATVALWNANDTMGIRIDIPDIVARAHANGGPVTEVTTFPDRANRGVLKFGRNIARDICSGVPLYPRPQVRSVWDLVGGTMTVTATPLAVGDTGMPDAARLDIELTDPSFQSRTLGMVYGYPGTITLREWAGGYGP